MYDSKLNIENQEGFVIEELTTQELKALRQITLGYGKLRAFARKVDLHESTIRDLIARGTALPETIAKVRGGLTA
jgi:hypothetical protein